MDVQLLASYQESFALLCPLLDVDRDEHTSSIIPEVHPVDPLHSLDNLISLSPPPITFYDFESLG